MITLAAEGTQEQKAMVKVGELFTSPQVWQPLPQECLDVAFRAKLFRMLSRRGCCIEYYFRLPHRALPTAIIKLTAMR